VFDPYLFKKLKKIMFLACFILATIITPPDVLSQIIVGTSFFFINELMVLAFIFKTKKDIYK
jgi:Sec-independent protein secretion pathway component TatC